MATTQFTQWLVDNAFSAKGESNLNDMRGGKYFIPDEQYNAVMARYFKGCQQNRYYLSELPRGAYRLYVDFDSSLPFQLPVPMNVAVSHCAALVQKVFGVSPDECEAILAMPSARKSQKPEFRAHLHFPKVCVAKKHLRMYLDALSGWLDQHAPFEESGVSWKSYIDAGCISLRLPYSFKRDHAGGFYRPLCRWCPQDGRMTQCKADDLSTLLECLVRAPPGEPLRKPCDDIVESRIFVESKYDSLTKAVLADEPMPPRMNEWLDLVLPPEYAGSSITKMKRSTECGTFVLCSNDKYCHIAKRYHSSNHVYFVCNRHGMFQRCTDDDCKEAVQTRYLEWQKRCEEEGRHEDLKRDNVERYGVPICHPVAFDQVVKNILGVDHPDKEGKQKGGGTKRKTAGSKDGTRRGSVKKMR